MTVGPGSRAHKESRLLVSLTGGPTDVRVLTPDILGHQISGPNLKYTAIRVIIVDADLIN